LTSTPRAFQAYARGDEIVVQWQPASDADLYVVQVDDDPAFASPFEWSVRDDGRGSYAVPVRVSAPGFYYARMRALRSLLIVSLQSAWTPIRSVVVGRPGSTFLGPFGSPFGTTTGWNGLPFTVERGPSADDLWLTWGSVPGAGAYLVQLAGDGSFVNPVSFNVSPLQSRSTQVVLIRNVPRARYFVRVQPVRSPVIRSPVFSSPVRIVDLRSSKPTLQRHAVRSSAVREIDFSRTVRVLPATGNGQGKGHLKHVGKPDTPGHSRDADHRDDD
jgi:hypothetical protein